MRNIFKLAALLLLATPATPQDSACEMGAVARWNKFANTSKAYTDKRSAGIRDVKLRERMRAEWEAVYRDECF